jgi:hypothetical protein
MQSTTGLQQSKVASDRQSRWACLMAASTMDGCTIDANSGFLGGHDFVPFHGLFMHAFMHLQASTIYVPPYNLS